MSQRKLFREEKNFIPGFITVWALEKKERKAAFLIEFCLLSYALTNSAREI